jgi:hypothetical protein
MGDKDLVEDCSYDEKGEWKCYCYSPFSVQLKAGKKINYSVHNAFLQSVKNLKMNKVVSEARWDEFAAQMFAADGPFFGKQPVKGTTMKQRFMVDIKKDVFKRQGNGDYASGFEDHVEVRSYDKLALALFEEKDNMDRKVESDRKATADAAKLRNATLLTHNENICPTIDEEAVAARKARKAKAIQMGRREDGDDYDDGEFEDEEDKGTTKISTSMCHYSRPPSKYVLFI